MHLASIADIAAVVRGRRIDLRLSQGDLAERAGVSRRWINQFEAGGRTTAEIGTVLRVIEAVGLSLHAEVATPNPVEGGIDLDALLDDLRRE